MTCNASTTVTLGCRLNAYESDRMAALADTAYAGEQAPVIINTCAVTSEAVRQSRQAIRRAKKDYPERDVIVTGCAVQIDPEPFLSMPEVTRVIGNGEKLTPAAWRRRGGDRAPADVFAEESLAQGPNPKEAPVRAHLEVQNGCDHRCTFCIIPFGRGRARSKAPDDVVREAEALAALGAREIVLTGVDLTSYGPDLGAGITLADALGPLLRALPNGVTIRLSSIDGAEVDDRLFALLTDEPRIAPYLHLSLQSGDTMILKRMKRRHTREEAVDLAARLKTARPDIALGADLIAGFPTETDAMFENSLKLVADCGLSFVHVFPFSPREGTPAARMPQHPRPLIKERAAALRATAEEALTAHLLRKLGKADTLLIEQIKDGAALGKLADFTDVVMPLDLLPTAKAGDRVPVRIRDTKDHKLIAAPTGSAAEGVRNGSI